MDTALAPLKLTLYGVDNEIKREVTRSIIPWGILERAIDLQENFTDLELDEKGNPINIGRDQITMLTDFVVFVFDDAITINEINRGASLTDMFAIYNQIFRMVSKVMPKNPTTALTPQQNLQKVRQGRKR